MSYNPGTGLTYIPTIHQSFRFSDDEVDLDTWRSPDWRDSMPTEGLGVVAEQLDYEPEEARGTLQAWDPVSQKQAWEVELPSAWNPGTLTTAGNLVFQGRVEGELFAYDATNGKILWEFPVGLGISAPPITYAIDGRQYVAVLVGFGSVFGALGGAEAADLGWSYGQHMRRLVVFSLNGKTQLPDQPPPQVPTPVEAPFFEVQSELALTGADLYGHCSFCHGDGVISGGTAPDLRASPIVLSEGAFRDVVKNGTLRTQGMPSWENLSDEQLNALRHFIREQAEVGLGTREPPPSRSRL